MAYCTKCGSKLEEGVKFCPKCGQPTASINQQQMNQFQSLEQTVTNKEKSKLNKWWLYGLIAVVVVIVCGLFFNSGLSTSELQEEVKKLMIEETKSSGQNLTLSDLTLVHQEGNIYSGLAKGTLDGNSIELDVKVVYDGNNVSAEWKPTAKYLQKEFNRQMKKADDEYNRQMKKLEEEQRKYEEELKREEEYEKRKREVEEAFDRYNGMNDDY